VSNRAGADQLGALLGPDSAAAGVDLGRPGTRVIANPTHNGGVAIAGQRRLALTIRLPSSLETALSTQSRPSSANRAPYNRRLDS
jgi:hypothetical protein